MSTHTSGWKVVNGRRDRKTGIINPPAVVDAATGDYVAVLGGGIVHFNHAEEHARLIAGAPETAAELAAKKAECESLRAALVAAIPALEMAAGNESAETGNEEEALQRLADARAALKNT